MIDMPHLALLLADHITIIVVATILLIITHLPLEAAIATIESVVVHQTAELIVNIDHQTEVIEIEEIEILDQTGTEIAAARELTEIETEIIVAIAIETEIETIGIEIEEEVEVEATIRITESEAAAADTLLETVVATEIEMHETIVVEAVATLMAGAVTAITRRTCIHRVVEPTGIHPWPAIQSFRETEEEEEGNGAAAAVMEGIVVEDAGG